MSIAFMSANPFSDKYAFKTPTKSVMFCDLTYDPRGDCVATTAQISDQYIQPAAPFDTPTKSAMVADLTTDDPRAGRTSLADEDSSKIATERDEIEVPILQWSPSVSHRSNSSVSSLGVTSTAPTSPMSEESGGPIVWHKGTLMYLVSLMKPEELLEDRLVFSPALEELSNKTYPIHLQLYKKTALVPPGFESYAKDLPIGTGRPQQSRTLIAESAATCADATEARRSLAQSLLSDRRTVSDTLDRFNVLASLHRTPTAALQSFQRAMAHMTCVDDVEWEERSMQLRGYLDYGSRGEGVDETCTLEARLEAYLLEVGRRPLKGWETTVSLVLAMKEVDRRGDAEVYADAVSFLGRAYVELKGA